MNHLLVCIDFSEITPRLIEVATTLAKPSKAKITLLHIAPPDPAYVGFEAGPQSERDQIAKHLREEHRTLQDLAGKIERLGLTATPLLVQGPTVKKLLEEVQRLQADIIIIGSHGRGAMYNLLVGSATTAILQQSKIPVLVVPASH